MMQSFRSRLDKIETAMTPRRRYWPPAVNVMANETTTDTEVEALLDREGISTDDALGPWVIVHRIVDPTGGDVLPQGAYVSRSAGSAQ